MVVLTSRGTSGWDEIDGTEVIPTGTTLLVNGDLYVAVEQTHYCHSDAPEDNNEQKNNEPFYIQQQRRKKKGRTSNFK